jgi:hypothetical protein
MNGRPVTITSACEKGTEHSASVNGEKFLDKRSKF